MRSDKEAKNFLMWMSERWSVVLVVGLLILAGFYTCATILTSCFNSATAVRQLSTVSSELQVALLPPFAKVLAVSGTIALIVSGTVWIDLQKRFGRDFVSKILALLPLFAVLTICIGTVILYSDQIQTLNDHLVARGATGVRSDYDIARYLKGHQFNLFLLSIYGPLLALALSYGVAYVIGRTRSKGDRDVHL